MSGGRMHGGGYEHARERSYSHAPRSVADATASEDVAPQIAAKIDSVREALDLVTGKVAILETTASRSEYDNAKQVASSAVASAGRHLESADLLVTRAPTERDKVETARADLDREDQRFKAVVAERDAAIARALAKSSQQPGSLRIRLLYSDRMPDRDTPEEPDGVGSPSPSGDGQLPHRAAMETSFGRDFSTVVAHVGADRLRPELGAQAIAQGSTVAFADTNPSPALVAHELTHVVQQDQAGAASMAAKTLVSNVGDPAEVEADAVAAAVSRGEPASSVAIAATPTATFHLQSAGVDAGGTAGDTDKAVGSDGRPDILSWAGAAPLRDVLELRVNHEDTINGDRLAIQEHYGFAVQGDKEMGSKAIYAVMRTMQFEFAGSVKGSVNIESRAHLGADRVPNDLKALVHSSAIWASHVAGIAIEEPESFQLLSRNKHAKGASLEDMIADDAALSFDSSVRERIDALRARYHKVRERDRGENRLDGIEHQVRVLSVALSEHANARKNFEDGDPSVIPMAENSLRTLEKERNRMASNLARGRGDREEEEQLHRIEKLYESLYKRWLLAKEAKPPDLDAGDYAKMAAKAPLKAGESLLEGLAELGLTGLDLVRYAGAEALGEAGVEMEWGAWSTVGKAYQEGKDTDEILEAMWDGFFDRLDKAFEHARNGNPEDLINLTHEVGVDFALGVVSGGVGTAASLSAKAGRAAEKAAAIAKRLKARTLELLKDAKKLAKNAKGTLKAWAVTTVEGFQDMLDNLAMALDTVDIGPDGTLAGRLPDGSDGKQMLERARLDVARDEAIADLKSRGVGGKGKHAHDLDYLGDSLQALAQGIKGGERAMLEVFEHMRFVKQPKQYIKAIEKLNESNIEADDLLAVLKRSTEMVDETAFLDDALWVTQQKINAQARKNLLQKAAQGKPPDLDWLRRTTLSTEQLQHLAQDPATNWKTFMKASDEPSDRFPGALEGEAAATAQIDAAAKIRGVSAEMVAKNLKLPDGFKIKIHQVDADGKILDFGLIDARGNTALLEVKGWTKKKWKEQLTAWKARQSKKKMTGNDKLLTRTFGQLEAAVGTGKPVYLAVSDSLDAGTRKALEAVLAEKNLPVTLLYFSEDKLKVTMTELKTAMALGAGVALFLDDTESEDPGEEYVEEDWF